MHKENLYQFVASMYLTIFSKARRKQKQGEYGN